MRASPDLPAAIKIRDYLNALNFNISVEELADKFGFVQSTLDTWLKENAIILKYNKPVRRYKEDASKDVELEFDVLHWAIGDEFEYGFGTKKFGEKMRCKVHNICNQGIPKRRDIKVTTRIVGNKLIVKRVR